MGGRKLTCCGGSEFLNSLALKYNVYWGKSAVKPRVALVKSVNSHCNHFPDDKTKKGHLMFFYQFIASSVIISTESERESLVF